VSKTTVIITMAGKGQRFRDVGYDIPKYRIDVRGRSLFAWSQDSLRGWAMAGSPFLFITRAGEGASEYLREQCPQLGISRFEVIELEHETDGQATTVLAATDFVADPQNPIAVYNIDTYVDPTHLKPGCVRGDGWIPCFPGEGSKWSFARVDESDRVLEMREKKRISSHATVGLYWFSSFELYRRAYDTYYVSGHREEAAERYIAPLYNQLLEWDLPCYIQRLPKSAVVGLGTPDDVTDFAAGFR
jgi:dTDP-glucose pyrophosphorylase